MGRMGNILRKRKSSLRVMPSLDTTEENRSEDNMNDFSTGQRDAISKSKAESLDTWLRKRSYSEQAAKQRRRKGLAKISPKSSAYATNSKGDEMIRTQSQEANESNTGSDCGEDQCDQLCVISSEQQLKVKGVNGPLAIFINGTYMCNTDLNTETVYHRCNDSPEEDFQVIIQYDDEERWCILHTGYDSEPFLLAYCAEQRLKDPSYASRWLIRS